MGFYVEQILSRGMARVMDTPENQELRQRAAQGLGGDIIEIGFGAGLNLPALPDEVASVHAVDPDHVGRRLAAERIEQARADVHLTGLDGQSIPLETASMDAALSTWTLCSIPDMHQALLELRRVLKPGGRFHFLEHGLSDEPKVQRWQRRLDPIQKIWAGGCRLSVPIDRVVRAAGFEIVELDNFYMSGSKCHGYMYRGVAINPGAPS